MVNYRYHVDCSNFDCIIYNAYIRINKKLIKIGYYHTGCHKFSLCDEVKTNVLQPESFPLLLNDEWAMLAKGCDEKLLGSNNFLLD